jgi:hypothetical protein
MLGGAPSTLLSKGASSCVVAQPNRSRTAERYRRISVAKVNDAWGQPTGRVISQNQTYGQFVPDSMRWLGESFKTTQDHSAQ